MDRCSYKKKKKHRNDLSPTCEEDTGKRQPSASQEEGPHQEQICHQLCLDSSASRTSRGILLLQPKLRQPNIYFLGMWTSVQCIAVIKVKWLYNIPFSGTQSGVSYSWALKYVRKYLAFLNLHFARGYSCSDLLTHL